MGSLRTLGWSHIGGQQELREMVIKLSEVTHAVEFDDRTSLLSLKPDNPDFGSSMIHVDIPIEQVERILHRHELDPTRKQRTHGIQGRLKKADVSGK